MAARFTRFAPALRNLRAQTALPARRAAFVRGYASEQQHSVREFESL